MKELAQIKKRTKPHNVLLVVDAMTGQDAVNVAEQFAETANFDGVILIEARRRRPRRRRAVGQGGHRQADPLRLDRREARRLRALPPGPHGPADPRHGRRDDAGREGRAPDGRAPGRRSSRSKIRKEQFTLDDFLEQMQQVRNMGPLGSLLKMMPGRGQPARQPEVDEKELDRLEAIIRSMTPEERANPKIIDGSRRRRIARGSGTTVQAVSQLVKQFGADEEGHEADRRRQDAIAAAAGRRSLTSPPLCPYESGSPAWAARRIRSGAWSSPTSARRAMAASSRRSATTTRRPSPRRS